MAQRQFDKFSWWNPFDWFGAHDETSGWGTHRKSDIWANRQAGRDPYDNTLSRQSKIARGDFLGVTPEEMLANADFWLGEIERQKSGRGRDLWSGNKQRALELFLEANPQLMAELDKAVKNQEAETTPEEDRQKELSEKNIEYSLKQQLRDLKNQQDNLKDQATLRQQIRDDAEAIKDEELAKYKEFEDLYKNRLGMADSYQNQTIQQAKAMQGAPSVVDAMIQNAYAQRLNEFANFAGERKGGGYLQDFNRMQANASTQGVGIAQKLAEQQARDNMLLQALQGARDYNKGVGQNLPMGLLNYFSGASRLPMLGTQSAFDATRGTFSDRSNLIAQQQGIGMGERSFDNLLQQQDFQNYLTKQGLTLKQRSADLADSTLKEDKMKNRMDTGARVIEAGTEAGKKWLEVL